jgi:CHAT domain-containing protein/tetratricopeptide (TPR) repeat protein
MLALLQWLALVEERQLRDLQAAFSAALGDDRGRAADLGERLIAEVAERGLVQAEVGVSVSTANAYLDRSDGDPVANIERACVLYERAISLIERDVAAASKEVHVDALLNLGAALGRRHRGDPAANQARAVAQQRSVLELITKEENGRLWAMAHTNLGLNLLESEPAVLRETEEPDDVRALELERLEEAIGHFGEALTYRSFERDPLDWAYTQMNLALAYSRRDFTSRDDLSRARDCYSDAIRGVEAVGRDDLRAWALGNRSGVLLKLAGLGVTAPGDRADLLDAAERDAREAIGIDGEGATGVLAGRRRWQLARVLAVDDQYTPELSAILSRALVDLTPLASPRDCLEVASRLGDLACNAEDWPVAAMAWEQAARAAAAAVSLRAGRGARLTEIARSGNVFRWAAYALVRAGDHERAVVVLELGRARELTLRLQRELTDLQPLEQAHPELCDRFIEQRGRVEAAEGSSSPTAHTDLAREAEILIDVLAEVRQVPGFQSFLVQPSLTDIVTALPRDETIAYPLTTPYGSAWLLVRPATQPAVSVIELGSLTSTEVVQRLLRMDADGSNAEGYIIEHAVTGPLLDEEIKEVAGLLGPAMMEPLAMALASTDSQSVCVVPLGLLSRVPLHALSWNTATGPKCLIDETAVAYAPSAYVRQVSLQRASARIGFGRLVVVGNPLPQPDPLPGAEDEARLVAGVVPSAEEILLIGGDATKEAVFDAIPSASHIHFACHGRAAVDAQTFDSALYFDHGRPASAAELLDLDLSSARLVVASACETGVPPRGYYTDEEMLALSTVLLGAGAAGVIASLWSVDDYATSLLMTRFYEELVAVPADPAACLRTASLWLRDLTPAQEAEYSARREPLAAQRQIRGGDASVDASDFGQPTVWAAFVLSGA